MKNKGFSLLELLTTTGIISLLLAISLPALSSAKEKAKKTLCQTQLRQIGIGYHMYANDNNENLPYAMKSCDKYLINFGKKYFDDPKIFLCPGDKQNKINEIISASLNMDDSVSASYYHKCYTIPIKLNQHFPQEYPISFDSSVSISIFNDKNNKLNSQYQENHKKGKNILYLDGHIEFTNKKIGIP